MTKANDIITLIEERPTDFESGGVKIHVDGTTGNTANVTVEASGFKHTGTISYVVGEGFEWDLDPEYYPEPEDEIHFLDLVEQICRVYGLWQEEEQPTEG